MHTELFFKAYFDRSQCQTIFIWLVVAFGSENDRRQTVILSTEVIVMW